MNQDAISAYIRLAAHRPELFAPSGRIPLLLDEDRMRAFSAETGKAMGLVYDNRPYFMVLADLCRNGTTEYSYARVVYPEAGSSGAVAVPARRGEFCLLRIYRHAPRTECLEFPRGFAEKGLTPEENIRRELAEELGAQVTAVRQIGSVRADTGLSAGRAQVFLAEIDEAAVSPGYEGIRDCIWLTEKELEEKIAGGEIEDGFTLSAWTLYQCRKTMAEA